MIIWFFASKMESSQDGAYPEIFRGRGFEIFLNGRESLRGVLGFFSLKTLAN